MQTHAPDRQGGVRPIRSRAARSRTWRDRVATGPYLVLCVALIVGALRGAEFLRDPRSGWTGLAHDRNGHYEFAQHLALSVRSFQPIATVEVVLRSKVWPPLHGICAALLLIFTGPDYRVAILPSLIGWVALVVVAYLITRDVATSAGPAAGWLAAALVIASPAYGHYSVDVMLESLGAALMAASVWLYVRARADPTPARWRALAIALLLLFFEKYNYWPIAGVGLAAAELLREPTLVRARIVAGWRRVKGELPDRRTLIAWPSAIVVALVLLTIAIWIAQPNPIHVFGVRVSLNPPRNLATVAWVALCVRVAMAWRPRGGLIDAVFAPSEAQLVRWLALPIAGSFLLPGRLAGFVGIVSPHRPGPWTPVAAASFYPAAASVDYHVNAYVASATAALVAAAVVNYARQPSADGAPLVVFLVGAVTVWLYPYGTYDSRFLHGFLALGWIAGAAAAARFGARVLSPRTLTTVIALAAAALLTATPVRGVPQQELRYPPHAAFPSALDLTDAYLRSVPDGSPTAIFATTPLVQLSIWTYRDRFGSRGQIVWPVRERLDRATLGRAIAQWAQSATAERVVFVDVKPSSPDYVPLWPYDDYKTIGALIDATGRFIRLDRVELPGRADTVVWRRTLD